MSTVIPTELTAEEIARLAAMLRHPSAFAAGGTVEPPAPQEQDSAHE